MNKRIIYSIISVSIGIVFIFSALSKLFPVQLFESVLVEGYFSTWTLAPYIARVIIAVELLLGVFFILNKYFSKKVFRVAMFILVVFTVHLFVLLFMQGNEGNCMCFGDVLSMTPLQSIVKNLILLACIILLFLRHHSLEYFVPKYVYIIVTLFVFFTPFALRPFFLSSTERGTEKLHKALYLHEFNTEVRLDSAKHVVAFLTYTCPHCRVAAYKMYVMKKKNPRLPLYFFLLGNPEDKSEFFEETKAENISYQVLSQNEFFVRAGMRVPAIYYIEDDHVVKIVSYADLSQREIEDWLSE
ncbi:MAG: MauE/DoxX family redox-associated membrane protein [Bacteroidota bacterium]